MVMFYILAGIAPFFSVATAIFLVADNFSVPTYAWVPAVAMCCLEAGVIGLGLYFVHSKKFSTDAWDLSTVVLPLWFGGVCTLVTVCWGSAVEDTTATTAEYALWGLCAGSRVLSLAFVCVSFRYHLLLLDNPDAASNPKQKSRYERKHNRRSHRHGHDSDSF